MRIIFIACLLACGTPAKPTDVTKAQAACLADRGAKLLECDHLYSTKALIDICISQQSAVDCHDAGAQ